MGGGGITLGGKAIPLWARNPIGAGLYAALLSQGITNDGKDGWTFYHGTSIESAVNLLNGAPLSADIASSNKIDGQAGFYLASDLATAEYAAARRGGGVIQYNISGAAMLDLTASGSSIQNIPAGKVNLPGYEFFIPPQSFTTFNTLRSAGEIKVTP